MRSPFKRVLALILMAALLLSNVNLFPSASAASLFYGDYTDVRKVYDSNSCPSMQGLAVGSQYLYTIKIKTDNSRAVITRTDKDTGSYTTLTDASTGYTEYEGTLTEWSETKPTNIPEDEIETKQQYRYADKITTTSSSATLDGCTLENTAVGFHLSFE